jgi:plastocyanin
MPEIIQLSTSNTFSQWLTGTQELITKVNSLTDGGNAFTFFANTNVTLSNNVTIGGDLTVTGNIILDEIGFDDLYVNGNVTIANTLSVTGNSTLSNATITYGNFETANITTVTSGSGLLRSSANVFVNDWVFSANANVRPGVTTFAVTNSGSSAYLFDQYSGNNPDIYLHPGQTVSFNINAAGHPFLIRESAGGTLYNIGLTHVSTTGVVTTEADAQAKQTGTLIWKVPFSLVNNTYVYQCQVHAGMVGNLIIQNTVTAAIGVANSASIYANGAFIAANTAIDNANSASIYANGAFIAANSASDDSLAFAIALG